MADLTLAQRFGSSVAFNPTTKVLSIDLNNNTLKVFVALGSKNDDETITLPEPEVQVSLAASTDGDFKVFVAVGSKNDSETITLPIQPVDFDPIIPFILNRLKLEKGFLGDRDYANAVKTYLSSLLDETKYADLINSATGDILLTAPKYWTTNILADFSLIQGKINNNKLCNLKVEEPDVVSIVASPKYVTNVDGKVLILHFVSEDNYPKRARGSSYRQIQIPGAKTEYNWDLHFKDLRWQQGNKYAELVLNEYRATVSGWFESESAANTFFDDVLSLTIGTEKNRKFPKHKFPRTDIQSQITRPYRAFIESINPQGQAICHVKYVPPIEP